MCVSLLLGTATVSDLSDRSKMFADTRTIGSSRIGDFIFSKKQHSIVP